jgi:hypothetical protein
MKESGKESGCVTLMIIAPLMLIGAGLLIAGLRTAQDTLTEDGLSQRTLLLGGGGVFLAIGLGICAFSLLMRVGSRAESLQRQHMTASYREGAARVQKLQHGNQLENDHRRSVLLTLEIVLPGRAPYTATWNGLVDQLFTGQLRPNDWLKVRVSPSDPQDFQIEWGEAAKVPAEKPSLDAGRP